MIGNFNNFLFIWTQRDFPNFNQKSSYLDFGVWVKILIKQVSILMEFYEWRFSGVWLFVESSLLLDYPFAESVYVPITVEGLMQVS